eukprot:TRINITY_DN40095_c0_g1_i1.p1 TRINITY_DN40095_c0_g1~~TRINITY_DN40095_c0_g1_i1.p1  ORF type:complete len:108 (+),score=11.04 TRINITY_DN40095_c0_g1_i1:65-388(+)
MWTPSQHIFFQAKDGIRDAQESRGLGDVYKRQREYTMYTQPYDNTCLHVLSTLVGLYAFALVVDGAPVGPMVVAPTIHLPPTWEPHLEHGRLGTRGTPSIKVAGLEG